MVAIWIFDMVALVITVPRQDTVIESSCEIDAAKCELHMLLPEKLFEVPRYTHDVLVQALMGVLWCTWPLVFIWTALPWLNNGTFMACSLLSKMMDETELDKAQLCRDLQPFFGEVRPPTKLKKVRQRLQTHSKSVTIERLVAVHGLDKLWRFTLGLVNEGSFRPPVLTLDRNSSNSADANASTDRSGRKSVGTRSKLSS
jgi:hypothetical protein